MLKRCSVAAILIFAVSSSYCQVHYVKYGDTAYMTSTDGGSNYYLKTTIPDGYYKVYYSNKDTLMYEENFKNGTISGIYINYYSNGKICYEGFQNDGVSGGTYTTYYPWGQISTASDIEDSISYGCYPDGEVKYIAASKGKKGWTNYNYYLNGNIEEKYCCDSDIITDSTFYINKKVCSTGRCTALYRTPLGKYQQWGIDGSLTRETTYGDSGKIIKDSVFNKTQIKVDSSLMVKILRDNAPWDVLYSPIDSLMMKKKVHTLTCNYSHNLGLSNRVTDIYEYDDKGRLIREENGNNITHDSINYDACFTYDSLGILREGRQKVFTKTYSISQGLNSYDENGAYLGPRYKPDSDGIINLISKYIYDSLGKLTDIMRYYANGELASDAKTNGYDYVDAIRALPDSITVGNVKTINYEDSYLGKIKETEIYSNDKRLLKEYYQYPSGNSSGIDSTIYRYNKLNKLTEAINYYQGVRCGRYLRRRYINDTVLYKEFSTDNYTGDSAMSTIKTYDAKGNVVKIETWDDPNYRYSVTKYAYNDEGLEIMGVYGNNSSYRIKYTYY